MKLPLDGVRGSWKERSELVAQAVDGDPRAVSTLLRVSRPMVLDWALTRVGCRDDAEDVTQQVLLKVYCNLRSFRREASFPSWLFRITANEAWGHWRRELRRRPGRAAWWSERASPQTTPSDVDRIAAERACRLIQNLACALPPLQAEVFRLVDLSGMEPCEAARTLDRTQTNVRSSLSRARKKIRELVEEARGGLAEDWGPSPC